MDGNSLLTLTEVIEQFYDTDMDIINPLIDEHKDQTLCLVAWRFGLQVTLVMNFKKISDKLFIPKEIVEQNKRDVITLKESFKQFGEDSPSRITFGNMLAMLSNKEEGVEKSVELYSKSDIFRIVIRDEQMGIVFSTV